MKIQKISLTAAENSLHERAIRAARAFQDAQSELLKIVIEVDCCRLFEKLECSSTFEYCVKRLGLSEDMACSFIGVARKAKEAPALVKAVEEGLPISKAKKIVPVLNPENQALWVEKAKALPYRELEREIAKVNPGAASVEKVRPISAELEKLELCLESGAFKNLRMAQDLLSTKLGRAASLAETIRFIAEEYVQRHDPVKKAERARKQDAFKIVKRRDQGQCRVFDGEGKQCEEKRWLHLHHQRPRSEGGSDTVDNLVTICGFHHRLFHKFEDASFQGAIRRATDREDNLALNSIAPNSPWPAH